MNPHEPPQRCRGGRALPVSEVQMVLVFGGWGVTWTMGDWNFYVCFFEFLEFLLGLIFCCFCSISSHMSFHSAIDVLVRVDLFSH